MGTATEVTELKNQEAFMLKKYMDIAYRQWKVKKPKGVFVLVHGMGGTSDRYKYFAAYFMKKGYSGYSMDLPGFGELAGENKGHVDKLATYHKHIEQMKEVAVDENPGKPVFLLGESMGGLIVASHVINYDEGYNGVIAIVPAFNDVFSFTIGERLGILIKSIVNPKYPVEMPFKEEDLTTDKRVISDLHKNKLEHRFASAGLLRRLMMEQLFNIDVKIKNLRIPILMLLSGRDHLVDEKFNEKMFRKIRSDKELKIYENSLHALTIEKNRMEVFKDIIKWTDKHLRAV
jgi:alpha-beta hydrolase superfamily lysophospholipase